jgi:hypothetical protein
MKPHLFEIASRTENESSTVWLLISVESLNAVNSSDKYSFENSTILGRSRTRGKGGKGSSEGSHDSPIIEELSFEPSGSNEATHLECICDILTQINNVGGDQPTPEFEWYTTTSCAQTRTKSKNCVPKEVQSSARLLSSNAVSLCLSLSMMAFTRLIVLVSAPIMFPWIMVVAVV